jgi:hypothetical protein
MKRAKPKVADLSRWLSAAVSHSYSADKELSWAESYKKSTEISCGNWNKRAREMRCRILRQLIRCVEISNSYERFITDPTPLVQHRAGGKLFLLVYNPESGSAPCSREELEKNCILVVIDDPAGGAA